MKELLLTLMSGQDKDFTARFGEVLDLLVSPSLPAPIKATLLQKAAKLILTAPPEDIVRRFWEEKLRHILPQLADTIPILQTQARTHSAALTAMLLYPQVDLDGLRRHQFELDANVLLACVPVPNVPADLMGTMIMSTRDLQPIHAEVALRISKLPEPALLEVLKVLKKQTSPKLKNQIKGLLNTYPPAVLMHIASHNTLGLSREALIAFHKQKRVA